MGDLSRKAPLPPKAVVGLQLLALPRARQVLPFRFLTTPQPTALFTIARTLFPASWPNSTWGNYILPT